MNPFNSNRKNLKSTAIYCWRCHKESNTWEESAEHSNAHNRGKVEPPSVNEAKAKEAKKAKAGKKAKQIRNAAKEGKNGGKVEPPSVNEAKAKEAKKAKGGKKAKQIKNAAKEGKKKGKGGK